MTEEMFDQMHRFCDEGKHEFIIEVQYGGPAMCRCNKCGWYGKVARIEADRADPPPYVTLPTFKAPVG